MNIRKAVPSDLPEILRVYEAARAYMRASGNPDQWGYDYPPEDMLTNDIKCAIIARKKPIILPLVPIYSVKRHKWLIG